MTTRWAIREDSGVYSWMSSRTSMVMGISARVATGVLLGARPITKAPRSWTCVATTARAAGLTYIHQPVVGTNITPADVAAFGQLLDAKPGKILAHCRTGTRCTMLWLLSQSGKQPADQLLATARRAGYDLEALRPRLAP